jgi:hypothetical protein
LVRGVRVCAEWDLVVWGRTGMQWVYVGHRQLRVCMGVGSSRCAEAARNVRAEQRAMHVHTLRGCSMWLSVAAAVCTDTHYVLTYEQCVVHGLVRTAGHCLDECGWQLQHSTAQHDVTVSRQSACSAAPSLMWLLGGTVE